MRYQSNRSFGKMHEVKDEFESIREVLSHQLRGAALAFVSGLFSEEVDRLCGKIFSRKAEDQFYRGGWDHGSVKLSGQRMGVKKPRVRQNGKELHLKSYASLQDFDLLQSDVMKHMLYGVSSRNYEPLLEKVESGLGLKKSSVSRAFVRGSKQSLDAINDKDLGNANWFCLMLDGIEFAGQHVIVAMGMTDTGDKEVLGLVEGSSENHEVCKDLLQSLIDCNFPKDASNILFVLDGSKALRKALTYVYGNDIFVQRCIRHKERNILSYLPEKYHMEFRRRWKLIHTLTTLDLARKELTKLRQWLEAINDAALASLDEANEETLTVIQLQTPALLRKTLASTNPIESAFDKVRATTRRIKNWKTSKNQVSRWVASALLLAQKSFRKLKGYMHIKGVIENMNKLRLPNIKNAA